MANLTTKLARFVNLESASGCWVWTGALREGYGIYTSYDPATIPHRKTRNAHIVVYEHMVGPIPAGLQLDHLCRNRRCVNPDHLESVTQRENILRGQGVAAERARRITCKNGHPLIWDGWQRKCLPCIYARRAQRKAASAQNQ